MDDPTRLSVVDAARALRAGELTSVALTEAYLERIAAVDPAVRAYLCVTADVARAEAAAADARRAAGEDGLLLGIPYALKDLFTVEGVTTTAGSRMLADYVPPDTATAVRRLQAAGAVLLGKTNMDEFAMGSSTENSAFFPTRNPWDLARVPGGSSGGSAAAVAADLAAFALGTDTGGSIRQPASLCGVVGLKPTYGRVSRYGMVAFASSLDQAGPLTKDVADAALVLGTIAGLDPADPTSDAREVPDYLAALDEGHGDHGDHGDLGGHAGSAGLAGLRVGVPRQYLAEGLADDVRERVEAAIDTLVGLGATRIAVDLPHAPYAVAAYYLVATAEASANLARYDGVRYGHSAAGEDVGTRLRRTRDEGFGPEVKRRIMLGTYALSSGYYDAYYRRATEVRALIRGDLDAALAACDVLVGPTAPTTAFPLGEKTGDPLAMYLNDIYTIPANLAGHPGISVPCGLADGLPVGLQIVGRPFDEAGVLRVAHHYTKATAWQALRPDLALAAS